MKNCSSAKQHIAIKETKRLIAGCVPSNLLSNLMIMVIIFLLLLIHADGKTMVAHGTIAKVPKRDKILRNSIFRDKTQYR